MLTHVDIDHFKKLLQAQQMELQQRIAALNQDLASPEQWVEAEDERGGNLGLWALRMALEHLGARVYPDMFSLAQAHLAFDDHGAIKDLLLQQRFDGDFANFLDLVEASRHYPCIKRAWVEYLGEHMDPRLARVQTAAAGNS